MYYLIGSYIKYGGICSKVRVMYGRRLLPEDYNILLGKNSISDIIAFLKDHPAYKRVLANVDERLIHRGQLEDILSGSLIADYKKLHDFASNEDKKLFKTFMLRSEIEYILVVLRYLKSKSANTYPDFSSYEVMKFPEEVMALSKAANIEEFLAALEKTRYAGAFKNLNIKELNFSHAENALTLHFYTLLFNTISKAYKSEEAKILEQHIGMTIDVKNIVRIIRIKKYFPNVNIYDYMLPFGKRLKDKDIKALIESENPMETLKGISNFYYSRLAVLDLEILDDYEDELIYETDKSIMRMGRPSMAIPLSYLSLKNIEVHNIIHIIEGVRYSVPPEDIKRRLSGVFVSEEERKSQMR